MTLLACPRISLEFSDESELKPLARRSDEDRWHKQSGAEVLEGYKTSCMSGMSRSGWYLRLDVFIPFHRREWSLSICHGGELRDPSGGVALTGPAPGQAAVHPLSRLDRPAVTHSSVNPWAGGFEIWQHNQFPWFMMAPKRGRAERLGSWERKAEGEMLTRTTAMYSSTDTLLLALSVQDILQNTLQLWESLLIPVETFTFCQTSFREKSKLGSAAVQKSTLQLKVFPLQINED